MTAEWIERRVADLEVGDDVRDYGVVSVMLDGHFQRPVRKINFDTGMYGYWPAHARVDIRRPAEVTVRTSVVFPHRSVIFIGTTYVGGLCNAHAEEYAARLRSSAHDRALALGKDTP